MISKRIALLATAGALSLALAACGGGDEEGAPATETNVTNLEEAPADPLENVAVEAPPATRIDNSTAETLPEETLTADEQTQEDADAAGMTARVARDEAGNEGTPAQ